MSKDKKKSIEIQYENCKTCGGTGRNFYLGPQPPRLKERLCSECWGMGKRPIQHVPEGPQTASPMPLMPAQPAPTPQPPLAPSELPPTVEEASAQRELTPEEVQAILEPDSPYAGYEQMDEHPSISAGYSEDAITCAHGRVGGALCPHCGPGTNLDGNKAQPKSD